MEQAILDAPTTSKVKVYDPIEAGIALMLEKHGSVLTHPPVVMGDAKALTLVKASRQELVKFRTTLEKARKDEKSASLVYGKLVDDEARRIQAYATPLEEAYDKVIATEEKRLSDIRTAELEAERVRIAGHHARIQVIKDVRETANMCRTSERVQQLINGMPALIAEPFEEFQDAAETAFNEVCTVLGQLHGVKVDAEKAADELKREQDAFNAQRLEQEVSDRAAAAVRAEEEKAAQARREEQESELQAKQLAFEKEQAKAQQAQQEAAEKLAAQQREFDEREAHAAADLLAANPPTPLTAQDIAEGVVDAEVKPAVHANGAPMYSTTTFKDNGNPIMLDADGKRSVFCDIDDEPAVVAPPTLRLGQINERLKLCSVSTDQVRALGFEPAGRDRAAVLYHESDFSAIRCALIEHLEKLGETA